MTFETAQLSKAAFELRVRTYGGTIVSRHSAATHTDGRYQFILGASESPFECCDTHPNGTIIKGHAITVDGLYDIVVADCMFCRRDAGLHTRPGKEVLVWLSHMPSACKKWWQDQGCDGSGTMTVGGDDAQGYFIDCPGCVKCRASTQELV